MLDAIEALLENRATSSQIDIVKAQHGSQNGDRAIERDTEQLLVLRDRYKAEVDSEERAASLARGERVPSSIKVRFTR